MDLNGLQDKLNSIQNNSKILEEQFKEMDLNIKFNDKYTNIFQSTYLENRKSITELYKLFIFYGMLEYYFDNLIINDNMDCD
tara:strand:+ start:785 stop:1030 length:246 start_codon:yes stop_codon:yes gene_type:complete